MPDDNPDEGIQQHAIEQRLGAEAANPQPPPNNPNGRTAQDEANADVKAEITEIEGRLKRAELWMIIFTGAIAVFGLCAVIVGVLQWKTMSGQLGEMKSGGADTHALAEAAKAQATAASAQAEQAKAQVAKMGESVTSTNNLVASTNILGRQAGAQSRNMDKVIDLGGKIAQSQYGIPELRLNKWTGWYHSAADKTVSVQLRIQNDGPSPAYRVEVAADLDFLPAPPKIYPNNFRHGENRVCPVSELDRTVVDPARSWAECKNCLDPPRVWGRTTIPPERYRDYYNRTLYVWGKVRYQNTGGFVKTVTFCRFAKGERVLTGPEPQGVGDYEVCPE